MLVWTALRRMALCSVILPCAQCVQEGTNETGSPAEPAFENTLPEAAEAAADCTRPAVPALLHGSNPGDATVELNEEELERLRSADCTPDDGQRVAALQAVVASIIGARLQGDDALSSASLAHLEEALVWGRIDASARESIGRNASRLLPTPTDLELGAFAARGGQP